MSAIRRFNVELETVTPLFLGGAYPHREPELRAPTFRGAMRYWLRAALGGVYGDDDDGLAAVRKAEAQVFGSTEQKWGGASAITVLVRGDLSDPEPFERGKTVWVNKHGKRVPQPTGRDYLYYAFGFKPGRSYYPQGGRISLELRVRPGIQHESWALQGSVAALWLLVHLGGIGARSRRTAGCLSFLQPPRINGLHFGLRASTTSAVAHELGEGLSYLRQIFQRGHEANSPSSTPSFDVLHPDTCKVWVLGMWRSSAEAVEAIGAAMRDFRTYREPDHSQVAKWLTGSQIETIERAVFGLPLQFRYGKGRPQGTVRGRTEPQNETIDRRASPLWLKVSKTGAGSYVGVATLFLSRFLPSGERLHEQHGKGAPLDPPADYSLIERFIAEEFRAEEVSYE